MTGPTCPKCGQPVLADQPFRLAHGDVEHRGDCNALDRTRRLPTHKQSLEPGRPRSLGDNRELAPRKNR